MTVDDVNSIYVGSLPYTATEDTIRRVFGPYGAIVAVKIINNDQGTRGKCYCFVTFRNPRSVVDAINDMNGKTIDGRVVRVNEVTTRGGRSNSNRERFRRNAERGTDWDRGRDRESNYDLDRDRYRERFSDRSRERDQSWDHDEGVERRHEVVHDGDRLRDGYLDGDQRQDRVPVGDEPAEGKSGIWNRERGYNLLSDQEREADAPNGDCGLFDKETDHQSRKLNDARYDQHNREMLSNSSGDYSDEVEERLEKSIQRRDELRNEILQMQKRVEDKRQSVLNLKRRTETLEDSLIMAKKHTSKHKTQLMKLHKCFLQVKEYSERLKSCEQELQSLVDSAITQSDVADDVGIRNGVLINGRHDFGPEVQ